VTGKITGIRVVVEVAVWTSFSLRVVVTLVVVVRSVRLGI
jgi:hypothetical protein